MGLQRNGLNVPAGGTQVTQGVLPRHRSLRGRSTRILLTSLISCAINSVVRRPKRHDSIIEAHDFLICSTLADMEIQKLVAMCVGRLSTLCGDGDLVALGVKFDNALCDR